MENADLSARVMTLERHLRNMRMAVIVVVAFFVYEALMPPELRPGREKVHKTLKTEELVLTSRAGDVFARLVIDDRKGRLVLTGADGGRVNVDPAAVGLSLRGDGGETIEQLRITPEGVFIYDRDGRRIRELSRRLEAP